MPEPPPEGSSITKPAQDFDSYIPGASSPYQNPPYKPTKATIAAHTDWRNWNTMTKRAQEYDSQDSPHRTPSYYTTNLTIPERLLERAFLLPKTCQADKTPSSPDPLDATEGSWGANLANPPKPPVSGSASLSRDSLPIRQRGSPTIVGRPDGNTNKAVTSQSFLPHGSEVTTDSRKDQTVMHEAGQELIEMEDR